MVFRTNRLRFLECCLSAVIYFSHISKPVAKNTQNKKNMRENLLNDSL